jgi:tetratricopeptide (TPR) repeat protein
MNRQHYAAIIVALSLLAGLYFLAPTVKPGKPAPAASEAAPGAPDFDAYYRQAQEGLSPQRQQYVQGLEAQVKRGDVLDQAIHSNHLLAAFWRDSMRMPALGLHFEARAAELVNTEKSLTFAAHSILGYLPYARSEAEQVLLAKDGKQLFEKSLQLNPANDSAAIGLGGCIMYGASDSASGGPMAGIMRVRAIADKDSTNLFAQYMLGIGGMISRQYDRAAVRFEKVVAAQPNNMEALFKLAEAYEMLGDKAKAAQWYEVISSKVEVPEIKAELNKRIAELKGSK